VCVWLLLRVGLRRGERGLHVGPSWRKTDEEVSGLRIFLIALILLLIGAGVFLVVWEVPAPTQQKEIVIPPERFQR